MSCARTGQVVVPAGVRPYAHELATANRLAALGHAVEFLPADDCEGADNPDILLDGVPWEMKSPLGSGKRTIDNQLRRAGRQCSRLVLDLARTPLDDDESIAVVRNRIAQRTALARVLVLRKDGAPVLIRRVV